MDTQSLVTAQAHDTALTMSAIVFAFMGLLLVYEWLAGRYKDGKKTKEDWAMAGLALGFLATVQRPALTYFVFFIMSLLVPTLGGGFHGLEQEYFWPGLLIYLLIDEYLHGRAHLFAHSPKPKNKILERIQAFYKISHRPHHQIGGNDGKGELSTTHTYVEHWGWWLILPNYWFGLMCLYLGFYEVFFWGTLIKAIWGMHVHTNWGFSYDLYLLNHKNSFVRKLMTGLCHVLVFPNMHHQHHSRSANSKRNMCNLLSIYDWLLWDSLAIEKQRPKIYGWRQSAKEEFSPMYRFFNTDLNRR